MEIRDVVTLVLGSNFIIAVATFLTTFLTTRMQIKNSAKQFEKEFEKSIVTYQRDRRREVRSEPLRKLRDELARMASKQDVYAGAVYLAQVKSSLGMEEEAKKDFERAADDWVAYCAKGDLTYTVYLQYDSELLKKVEDVRINYPRVTLSLQSYKDAAKLAEAMENIKKVRAKIVEVQELINKKLEEL